MIALINFCAIPWFLKWLLPFLLGLLGGWAIWSKRNQIAANVAGTTGAAAKPTAKADGEIKALKAEYDSCKSKRLSLEKDNEASKKKIAKLNKEIADLKAAKSTKASAGSAVATAAAGLAAGAALTSKKEEKPDNWNHASARVDDKEQIRTLKASLDSLREKNNSLSSKYEVERKEKENLQFKFESLEKEVADLKGTEEVEEAPKVNVEEYEAKLKAAEDKYAKSQEDIANLKSRYTNVDREISKAEREATEWKIKYNALKQQKGGLKGNVVGTSAIVAGAGTAYVSDQIIEKNENPSTPEVEAPKAVEKTVEENVAPKSAPAKKSAFDAINSDNLQIIEGVGPKMEEVLKENGISDFAVLSSKTPEELQAILDKYDGKYKIIDPKTWAQQATLAKESKWEELISLQKDLDGGSAETAKGETDSKLEKYLIKVGAIKRFKKDDLKAIEGIGPKLEEVFHGAGIKTWKELSETSQERLKEILTSAGSRFALAVPDTWPKQAKMADEGKWDELQEYQDYLDGGKEPS